MKTGSEGQTIYAADRSIWRQWLSENYLSATEVWLVIPLKESGETGISYNDAVEEALCFGWIDSTIRNSDTLHRIQRFTPRRKGSTYSRPNVERLIWLDRRGMILPEIRQTVAELIEKPYEYPEDIIAEIRNDEAAWINFKTFPDSYRRIRVAYVDAARDRPEEFNKRLRNLVSKTHDNKIIRGYGGIEKYYGENNE